MHNRIFWAKFCIKMLLMNGILTRNVKRMENSEMRSIRCCSWKHTFVFIIRNRCEFKSFPFKNVISVLATFNVIVNHLSDGLLSFKVRSLLWRTHRDTKYHPQTTKLLLCSHLLFSLPASRDLSFSCISLVWMSHSSYDWESANAYI